jgi:glycosyltransferase involved in cell wall biosynthesis
MDLTDASRKQRVWAEEMFDAQVLLRKWENALAPFRQTRHSRAKDRGSVGACIPCFNAEVTLSRAARSVRGQSVKVRELVIVDDGSTDSSVQVAEHAADRCVRFARNLGRGAARQRGIEELDEEYVLFCDAGLELPPTFVEKALTYFTSDRIAAVFGIVSDPNPKSFCDRWRNRHLFKAGAKGGISRNASLMTGGALLKRSAIIAVGGFNPRLVAGEDQELGERLLRAGYEVICDPGLRLRPLQRDSVVRLFRRYARWNRAPGHVLSCREYARSVAYHLTLAARDLVEADLPGALLTLAVPHYLFWCRRRPVASAQHSELNELKGHSVVEAA